MAGRYRATVASIRTAYGQRLRAEDYRSLLNMHSVAEVVTYLKGTPAYGELLADLDPAITHRGYLEMLLRRNLFHQCLHFCSIEQLRNEPFFRFFLYEYEIRELVKAVQLGRQGYISAMDTWLAPYLRFSQNQLARADGYAEITEAVAQTPYAAILRRYLTDDGTPPAFSELEIALRAKALETILKEAEQTIRGNDLDALRGLIGEQIDLINIINAYRLKSVFSTDKQTLMRMMLPIPGRLPKRLLTQLYDAPDAAAFEEILRGTRYGRLLTDLPDTPGSVRMEHAFQLLRYRNARSALHFSGHAAVSLYAVHFLNQVEVQNLITIIEGIRYEKPVSYMQALLITEPASQ